MTHMVKCQKCQVEPAIWAKQELDAGRPTYTLLGSHYRGWPLAKVCNTCKNAEQAQREQTEHNE